MPRQTFNSPAERIGTLKGEILPHAVPHLVLGISGNQKRMKRNMGDTVIYRRWLPFGATTTDADSINRWVVDPNQHQVQEGVTPDADKLVPQDITVQLNQYACLYSYTDKVAELYEDKIPPEMKTQTGERMGLLAEKIDYGTLKGCTNRFYAGGTSRSTVDKTISLPLLRRITRSLTGNHGKMVTRVLSPSPNFNTAGVEAGFLVFIHTNMEHDVRELPGFKSVPEYGSMKTVHDNEVGACDRYRFIYSAELDAIINAGAAVGVTGLMSTGGSNIDVYPCIVVAADAWASLALRGAESFDVIHIPHDTMSKEDPLKQRGYVGAKFYRTSFIENDGWMAVAECGASKLEE